MPKFYTKQKGIGGFYTSGVWASAQTLASALAIGSNGSFPTSSDEAYILVGSCKIENNLTSSAFTGTLTIGPEFGGTIGTEGGASLQTNCLQVRTSGYGPLQRFKGAVTAYQFYGTGFCFVETSLLTSGNPTVYVGPGANVEFGNGVKVETIYNAGGFVSVGTAGVDQVVNHAGSFLSRGDVFESLDVRGGDATLVGTCAVHNAGNSAVVFVGNNARYIHASTGIIDDIEVYPNGVASDRGAPGPFTVTGANIWPDASLFENPSVRITYTNPVGRRAMP